MVIFSFYFVRKREVHDCQVCTPEGGCCSGMFDVSSFSAALSSSGLVPDCSARDEEGEEVRKERGLIFPKRAYVVSSFDYDRETKNNVSHKAGGTPTDSITNQTEIQEIAMQ